MIRVLSRFFGRLAIAVCAAALVLGGPSRPRLAAAEREFVGVLAVAIEGEVADKLGLTEKQKEQLLEIIDARESEALELAIQLKSATPEERAAKLAAFRQQSEAKGLALLTKQQAARLQQVLDEQQRGGAKIPSSGAGAAGASSAVLSPSDGKSEKGSNPPPSPAAAAEKMPSPAAAAEKTPGISTAAAKTAASRASKPSASPAAATDAQAMDPDDWDPLWGDLADQVLDMPADTAGKAAVKKGQELLRFSFRYQPWKDVLDWFAEKADLSLIADDMPKGTFNYTDDRQYTPAQAIDLLNNVLATKGYLLVRRDRMLILINQETLKEGIPQNLVDEVTVEDLDKRGDYDLVRRAVSRAAGQPGGDRARSPQAPRTARRRADPAEIPQGGDYRHRRAACGQSAA